ncbi:hypothetical protein [Myxococcus stipitatus]|uniref:hypothetical protein n=1 Tax=Myxococcus stipitatus TaxID=83455 RepID=UPI0030D0257B
MASPSRSPGIAKNVLTVALFLLVGGAVAFALWAPSPSAPGAPPMEPVAFEPVAFDAGATVATGAPVVPEGGPVMSAEGVPVVPPGDEELDRLSSARRVEPRRPERIGWGPALRVWCEGLPVEHCGKYPKDCEVGVYCDGERFCRRKELPSGQETCAGEGIQGAVVACCPGLVARCGAPSGGETCDPQKGDESEPVCIRCGDGVCGPLEQPCNCPEDCAPSEARPKLRYQGLWPEGLASKDAHAPVGTTTPGQCLDARRSPESIHRCLVSWGEGLFGLSRAAELRRVDVLVAFTPFDVDLMGCLELASSYSRRRSESSREGCLEALYQRTQDPRLDKLRWFSSKYGGGR